MTSKFRVHKLWECSPHIWALQTLLCVHPRPGFSDRGAPTEDDHQIIFSAQGNRGAPTEDDHLDDHLDNLFFVHKVNALLPQRMTT